MDSQALAQINSPLPVQVEILPPDRHSAAVYLARLGAGSRRAMKQALDTIAALLTNGKLTAEQLPSAALRYQHTAAIRAMLMERYKPAAANKILAALRGVLKECWRLGYMAAEDFHRAADVHNILRRKPAPR
jgi:hypothetical protein